MKRLFLASQFNIVAQDIGKKINKKGLKVAFIKTASEAEGKNLKWLEDDRNSLKKIGFNVLDYTITGKTKEQVESDLKDSDILFFSGGNTFYLLEKIQQAKCAKVIVDFIEKGKIYIGSSAGSIIAGSDISPIYDIDKIEDAPNLKGFEGFGLVNFVTFPHWGRNEKFREIYLNHRLKYAYSEKNKIILLTDKQYIEVKDDWYRIIEI